MRLVDGGAKIVLDPELRATHMKALVAARHGAHRHEGARDPVGHAARPPRQLPDRPQPRLAPPHQRARHRRSRRRRRLRRRPKDSPPRSRRVSSPSTPRSTRCCCAGADRPRRSPGVGLHAVHQLTAVGLRAGRPGDLPARPQQAGQPRRRRAGRHRGTGRRGSADPNRVSQTRRAADLLVSLGTADMRVRYGRGPWQFFKWLADPFFVTGVYLALVALVLNRPGGEPGLSVACAVVPFQLIIATVVTSLDSTRARAHDHRQHGLPEDVPAGGLGVHRDDGVRGLQRAAGADDGRLPGRADRRDRLAAARRVR